MNPLGGPILKVLFFPDWHDFLKCVNQESSGFESLDPVRTTDGHGNTDVTQFEMSEPVDDSTSRDGPLGTSVLDKFLQLRRCHLGIRIVVERQRASSIREFSDCAQEQHDGTGGMIADRTSPTETGSVSSRSTCSRPARSRAWANSWTATFT